MSILRETIRIRDEPTCAHPAKAPGHSSAVPALHAHLHAQQYRATTHRARAPSPGHAALAARAATQPHAVSAVPSFRTRRYGPRGPISRAPQVRPPRETSTINRTTSLSRPCRGGRPSVTL